MYRKASPAVVQDYALRKLPVLSRRKGESKIKIKLQIKSRWTGSVLFEYEKENNTIKDTLIAAVKSDANLSCAYLSGADLRGADLRGADLRGAKEIPYLPLACPSDGAFIGWKKVKGCLIQLFIPEDAKRCSATTQKCRCEFAKVLSIVRIENGEELQSIENTSYTPSIVYKEGEIVKPDSFDEDRWNECSHGIHFFINKQDALNY